MPEQQRFYGDLAPWWPLISPVEDYREEAAFAADLLRSAAIPVREVLELGSGGGNNAAFLSQHFAMTLVDLSAAMLDVSRQLNPDSEHHQADMRTVRLGRQFDAVFVHDAIDYMTTEDDLRAAIITAFEHCRPGGVTVLLPDHTAESFVAGTDHGGTDDADGRGVRYLEWSHDPAPGDTQMVVDYTFVLREADGTTQIAHEAHTTGLFGRETWLRLLEEVGFEPTAVMEETDEDRPPREVFVGHRPLA